MDVLTQSFVKKKSQICERKLQTLKEKCHEKLHIFEGKKVAHKFLRGKKIKVAQFSRKKGAELQRKSHKPKKKNEVKKRLNFFFEKRRCTFTRKSSKLKRKVENLQGKKKSDLQEKVVHFREKKVQIYFSSKLRNIV